MLLVDIEDNNNIIITLLQRWFSVQPIKVALVYWSPKSPVTACIVQLFRLASIKKVDILLGDYNIDPSFYDIYAGVYSALSQRKLNGNLT